MTAKPPLQTKNADPRLWADSALANALAPLKKSDPVLAEYMQRVEMRVARQRKLASLWGTLIRQRFVAVLDMEATCFNTRPDSLLSKKEVIEIGWALLDTVTLQIVDRQHRYIRPTTSKVSRFCTELTGIRPEQVAHAMSFAEAMRWLAKLHTDHVAGPIRLWGAFGEGDRTQLTRQCLDEAVPYPLQDCQHFDIKETAGAYYGFGKNSPGLARAISLAGLELEGRPHSGLDDAVNTARVLAVMLRNP